LKNLLITFEGIDGCGKSTQASLLHDRLVAGGVPSVFFREPGGTAVGERIRSILLDTAFSEMSPSAELFLYLAARAQITVELVRPALSNGVTVILDRYLDSTAAYQGYARGIGIDSIRDLNRIATGCLVPDVTFLLDCSIPVALSRQKKTPDRLESEGDEFLNRVREGYLFISNSEPGRFVTLDGSLPVSQLHDMIFSEFILRSA